jgi:hypothetical protein
MALLELVRDALARILPVRVGDLELQADLAALALDDEGVSLPLQLARYDAVGTMFDTHGQTLPIVERVDLETPPERVRAYLEGWAAALPELIERAREESGSEAMPHECICPPALRFISTASSPGEFEFLFRRATAMWTPWKAKFTEPFGYVLDDARYAAFLAKEQPESMDEAEARRVRAIEDALAAFPEVSAKVRAVFGLELPRTVMVFDAFWRSLSPAEHEACEALGLPTPAGVMEYFQPGGLERRVQEGLDARLHWRWRCDPPELVTAFLGHAGDGQHFGLFYDDPGKLPAGVVVNYGRDSAETWWSAPTLLDVVRERLENIEEESLTQEYHEDLPRAACQHRLVTEAINAFVDIEVEAIEADEPRLAMPFHARTQVAQVICGVGPLVPGVTTRAPYLVEVKGEWGVLSRDMPRLRRFIAEAKAALERGEPSYALALGRDLHWADHEELRTDTLELLVRAYRMLGREALAAIAEVHHRHRDLPWVAIFDE